ncbi:MFS general substrate transporter [Armillaria gallica]|uniref:MFS general substrate transporter n=1 Tax=Armillaria gallica TaxID=47427 RepID=A0A2H3CGL6_ARMGA|nr:MFS general substrate transporter [Armillaria gallica]
MSTYSADSVSSKRRPAGPSIFAAPADEKQDGESELAIKNDDLIDPVSEKRLLRRLDLRLMPSVVLLYLFNIVARNNIGNARILNADTALRGVLSGFIAHGVGHLNGARGLEGWRWLFIVEGAPSCLFAIGLLFFLPSYPENALWLSSEDRDLSIRHLKHEACKSTGHDKLTWEGAKTTLKDGRLYLHYLAFFAPTTTFSSLSLFSPTLVSGLGYEGLNAQLFTIPPLVLAIAASVLVSWIIDRYRTRWMPAFISMVFSGVSFFIQGALPPTSFKARYAMLCTGTMFLYAAFPLLLTWLTGNIRGTDAMTMAIPMNMMMGTFGMITGELLSLLCD